MNMGIKTAFERFRQSNKLAVGLVYATLLIDNMLLTAIVPILPEYLLELEKSSSNGTNVVLTTIAPQKNTTTNMGTLDMNTISSNSTDESANCVSSGKHENLYVSFLIASKPFVQIIANVAVGPISDKIGFDIPMFTGYVVLIASSLIFAYGNHYGLLFFARALQGVGSACASTAGMGMLAGRFRDDTERGRMMGIALGGLAMGVLIGPPFASITYQFSGKKTSFLVLAGGAFVVGLLQFLTRQLTIQSTEHKNLGVSIIRLLKDPYILLASLALMLGNMVIGVLEAGMPIWMMNTMCATKWMLGVAFLPSSSSYLLSTLCFGWFGHRIGRWIVSLSSFYVSALGCVTLPFGRSIYAIIGPGFLIGVGVGMIDSSIIPVLGYLVDTRHIPLYGSVYAIADASFCLAFILGPVLAGTVIHLIGFAWLMVIVTLLYCFFAPLICFLRNPKEIPPERRAILQDSSITGQSDPETRSLGRIVEPNVTE